MKINSVFYQSIFYSLFRICKVEKWEFKNIRKKEKKNWKNYKIIIDIYNEMITLKQFLYKKESNKNSTCFWIHIFESKSI